MFTKQVRELIKKHNSLTVCLQPLTLESDCQRHNKRNYWYLQVKKVGKFLQKFGAS